MHNALPRQMLRQRAASGLVVLLVFAFVRCGRGGRCRDLVSCFVLGHALLEFGKLQFELIEQLLATLGRCAERVAPAQWKVIQHVREKFSCRRCEAITQPPAPSHPIARGRAGPQLLAQVLFAKYRARNLPLNRQSQ